MGQVEIRTMPAAEYMVAKAPMFIDTAGIHKLYDKLLEDPDPKSLILHGPKGVSKTLSIQSYACSKKIPLISVECSEDIRRSSLVGTFVMENDQTPFVLGDVTNAIDVANETGLAILCFEEVNALPPQIQKMLNSITDFRKSVNAPECKRIFRLREGARLWVTGTMNYAAYGGLYSLNEDFKSRFLFREVAYPSKTEEMQILLALYPKADKKILAGMTTIAEDLRQGNTIGYKLSTRDLAQWVEMVALLGMKQGTELISGKYESSTDRSVFIQRCRAAFV